MAHSQLTDGLAQRWRALMQALGFADNTLYFDKLITAYSEPHRHYHTVHHLHAVLKEYDQVKQLAKQPESLELALWFHDAIYKIFSSKSERDSAQLAFRFVLAEGSHHLELARELFQLIMVTAHKEELLPKDSDRALIADIDLTVLALPSDEYDNFERNVRWEYQQVPLFIYTAMRLRILKTFLQRKTLYHTEYFSERCDQNARRNIERAIALIQSGWLKSVE